jgi:hypothetical protein
MTYSRVIPAAIPHADPAQRGAARLLCALALLAEPAERAPLFDAIGSLTFDANTDRLETRDHA